MTLVGKRNPFLRFMSQNPENKKTLKLLRTGHPIYVHTRIRVYAVAANRTVRNRAEQNGAESKEKRNTAANEKRELTAAGAQHVYWRISQS